MQKEGDVFSVSHQGNDVNVQAYLHLGRTIYHIDIPNKRLFITKSERTSGIEFWTSLPQGEQKLAETFGALIDDKLTTKQQSLF